jgi:DNA-binding CsgD family transcriptional regulator
MQTKTFRSIQRVCAAGLDSVTLRREVARRIAPAVPHDAYAFSTCDPDTGLMAHTVAQGVPPSLSRAYVERIYPTECATLVADMSHRGTTVVSTVDRSAGAREAFRSHGVDSHIHIALTADRRLWGTWCMMRKRESPPHEARSVAFLHRAGPSITRALRAATAVDRARSAADAADAASASPGVVVLDARNRPVVRTQPASRWLADLADSGIGEDGDVPLSVLSMAARLRRTRSDIPQDVLVRLRGASGQWYTLRASLAEPDASGSTSVVVVVRPAVRREIAPMLADLYGLSDRERQVVAAVARGEPTKCIAGALGVSPHTIEEHLERACRKIGVRGRKALVAKLFVDGYARTIAGPTPAAPLQLSVSSSSRAKR